ncbi:MAG: co-chaperone DjlA [Tatlockia sp.]
MRLRQFFISNTWWGKLIGALLGYLLGGSAGALIGILIGNFFDRAFNAHYSRPHWSYYSEKRKVVQQTFFNATFSFMGYIAKADGRVSEQAIQVAKQLMAEMRLNTTQKKAAQLRFNEGKARSFNVTSQLTELREILKASPDLLQLFIDIQYRAAQASGLSIKKILALDTVFRALGFAPLAEQTRFYADFTPPNEASNKRSYSYNRSHTYQTHNEPSDPLAKAYAMLEINNGCNKDEVKRAYRRMISRNHPDKLIAQGLPETMIKIANDKTQKITKAYALICLNRGWK